MVHSTGYFSYLPDKHWVQSLLMQFACMYCLNHCFPQVRIPVPSLPDCAAVAAYYGKELQSAPQSDFGI